MCAGDGWHAHGERSARDRDRESGLGPGPVSRRTPSSEDARRRSPVALSRGSPRGGGSGGSPRTIVHAFPPGAQGPGWGGGPRSSEMGFGHPAEVRAHTEGGLRDRTRSTNLTVGSGLSRSGLIDTPAGFPKVTRPTRYRAAPMEVAGPVPRS